MGNKSKRRQASVRVTNSGGYTIGVKKKDIGYGRIQKKHRSRENGTETVGDMETLKKLRREAHRVRKGVISDAPALR